MEESAPRRTVESHCQSAMGILFFIALVALCGCSPASKDFVGDWARPEGLRNWDGHVTGEDFVIHFASDGTYHVLDGGGVYRDQFSSSIYYYSGQNPPKWTGKWHLEGNKIYFVQDGHIEQVPIIIEHFSSGSFEVSCPWGKNLKKFTFHRVTLTNQQTATAATQP